MAKTILLVDDDEAVLASLALLLKQAGYATKKAGTPTDALRILLQGGIDLMVQDMNFSARQTTGEEGLLLLAHAKAKFPNMPVILMTAWGSIALAVAGIQAGANDFMTKPWMNEQVLHTIKMALDLSVVSTPHQLSRAQLDKQYDFAHIIGQDARLLKIMEMIGRVSQTDAPILITGESGTGKELIAEAIHKNSPRKTHPLVRVNLGSIPTSLFESELFGHVKGAFTDAKADRQGRFDLANQGTIFLDEIGDIDFNCQVKLLRVLQDRTFEPVGSSKSQTANVRVVSATNRNLMEMVQKGDFREDLLYRLNLIAIHLPALRERKDDIPLLAQHFLANATKVYRRGNMQITEKGFRWLQARPFPGNIRELRHLIERAVIVTPQQQIDVEDFMNSLLLEQHTTEKARTHDGLPAVGAMSLDQMEKGMILKTMEHHQGNLAKVAEDLGLSRFALYRRLEKYGIQYQP